MNKKTDGIKSDADKPPRKHNPKWKDRTSATRTLKRYAELQAAAELNGFDRWSTMLTYIKNQATEGRVVVVKSVYKSYKEIKSR